MVSSVSLASSGATKCGARRQHRVVPHDANKAPQYIAQEPTVSSNALHTSAPAAIHCIRAHPIVRATAPRRNTQRQAWQGGQQDEGLLVLSQHPHGVLVLPLRLHQHGMLLLPLSRTSSSARRCSDQGEATQVRETGAPTRKRGGLPEKSRAPRSITRRTNLCKVGGVRRNCGV